MVSAASTSAKAGTSNIWATLPTDVLDALAPNAADTSFPYPNLTTAYTEDGVSVCEGPTLAGFKMPGQWLLTGCEVISGWEIRAGNYLTGATLVPSGDPLTEITYSIRIWTSNDAGIYRQLLGTILKKPVIQITGTSGIITTNVSTAVIGIDDPSLKDVGITEVVVKSRTPLINPLVTSGGKGPWTATVKFLQWRAPIPALPIPDQTTPDPGALTPSAFNASQQENANLTAGQNQLEDLTAQQLLYNH